MEKRKSKILYRIILFFAVIFFIVAAYAVFKYYYKINLDEQLSCRITKDVIALNEFFSTVYLVKTNDGYFAVDAGMSESLIRKGLEYGGIKPEEIKTVLLTHLDWDHQGALQVFKNAKVWIPKREYEATKGKTPRFKYLPLISPSINATTYSTLIDGEILHVGGRKIKCISLAGHTLGSMGYIIDDKYLFSGDAFKIKNGKLAVPYIKIILTNLDSMRASIRKVSKLKEIEYIFTSYSGFTADFQFAVSEQK
jgi:hydroxyacylglutathione hydrolase